MERGKVATFVLAVWKPIPRDRVQCKVVSAFLPGLLTCLLINEIISPMKLAPASAELAPTGTSALPSF